VKKAKADKQLAAVRGKVNAELGLPGPESMFEAADGGTAPAFQFLQNLKDDNERILQQGVSQQMDFQCWQHVETVRSQALAASQQQEAIKLLATAMNPNIAAAAADLPPVQVPPPMLPPWMRKQAPAPPPPPSVAPPAANNKRTDKPKTDNQQKKKKTQKTSATSKAKNKETIEVDDDSSDSNSSTVVPHAAVQ